ncbi:alpha-L-fucosidase [Flagellimonas sp.]|uniref:alpha-L-fucosidase n=1 Tax=Flagellimonas sp. TaxID=2058762 RepID=UPI003BAE9881
MKLALPKILVLTILLSITACKETVQESQSYEPEIPKTQENYSEDWSSLGGHNESPDWFKEAKLGIYFHWGLYSVPAFDNEWYPRHMHFEDHPVYKYHLENYGHPSEFGYHDFAPLFKAEKFDSDKWAQLFVDAGAKFAGPVAEHHDGYAMWNSKITPWNTMDTGPNRDITGELEKSIKGKGLKFITAFHHAKNLQRATAIGQDISISHFPYFEGMPPTSSDPDLQLMYGNIEHEKWYKEVWLGKLKEVIDNYSPDIVWFDYVLGDIPEAYRKEFAAYYLNEAHKKDQEAVIVRKQHDLPLNMSVEDLEQSRKNTIGTKTWMTDATISDGSWCYTKDLGVKRSQDILHMLIDIVSKNGVLLLNISPMADGTIPNNQVEGLLEMGDWLKKYGEAIYGTEAWYTFGEGPTKEPTGHFENHDLFHKIKYSSKDIRYTTKDYTIYAIIMGKTTPNQQIMLESFAKEKILDVPAIETVTVLGSESKIAWEQSENGLYLTMPGNTVDEMATVIKITISQ